MSATQMVRGKRNNETDLVNGTVGTGVREFFVLLLQLSRKSEIISKSKVKKAGPLSRRRWRSSPCSRQVPELC